MGLTRVQKEKRVIELDEQGKSIREIAKDVHMSFAAISSIIKKHKGEDNDKEKTTSKDTQAIKLYSQGKDPVEAVIELDLSTEEAKRVYREFCMLKDMHHLGTAYEEIQNEMPSFLKLFRMIKDEGFGEGDVIELLQCSSQLPSLGRNADSLKKEIKELNHKWQDLSAKIINLDDHLNKLEKISEEKQSEVDELAHKIKIKEVRLKVTKDFIDDLENSKDYLKINEIIEKKVTSLLSHKNNLIIACTVTALLAIRNDPNKNMLIQYFDYYHNPVNDFSDTNNVERYIQTNHPQLLEIISMFQDKVLKTVQSQVFPSLPKQ